MNLRKSFTYALQFKIYKAFIYWINFYGMKTEISLFLDQILELKLEMCDRQRNLGSERVKSETLNS